MTTRLIRETSEYVEGRRLHLADAPITFEKFLDLTDENDDLELVNGVIVERMSAQYPHERRFVWLLFLLNGFVRQRGLGVVLGSRSAVEIDTFGGRLPDILFVSTERQHVIQDRAIYGQPDLVIEIISANDRPSDILALETDYRSIKVDEIVLVDPQKRQVTVLRRADTVCTRDVVTEGTFHFDTVRGFHVDISDLLRDHLPNEVNLLNALLAEQHSP